MLPVDRRWNATLLALVLLDTPGVVAVVIGVAMLVETALACRDASRSAARFASSALTASRASSSFFVLFNCSRFFTPVTAGQLSCKVIEGAA